MKVIAIGIFLLSSIGGVNMARCQHSNIKMDGYRGIWFELNQKYAYGDKYSGALGTYTAKHIPLAIYAKEVDKTFFVYGGTPSAEKRALQCMIGEFDHSTGLVSKPTLVFQKEGVDDPHDNPSLMIDKQGYLWVFISGRAKARPGYKFKSVEPYSIDRFEMMLEEEFTYPQPWKTAPGYFHFFTKYTGVRQLYFETSMDGITWTEDQLLAAIPEQAGQKSGHYQVSSAYDGQTLGTFFNRHPQGNVDRRTDLYFAQSSDFGKTWTTSDQIELELPIASLNSPARAVDYAKEGKNVYLKDMAYDLKGNPICLYIRSGGHEPGPISAPYEWCITKWNNGEWQSVVVTTSDHNYDMGSLFIEDGRWSIVGPTRKGPQEWGVGGELEIWESRDNGKRWKRNKVLTKKSKFSHSYVRKSINGKAPFNFFWSEGDSHAQSKCELHFGDFEGNIWKLPYDMDSVYEMPIRIKK